MKNAHAELDFADFELDVRRGDAWPATGCDLDKEANEEKHS